MSICGLKAVIVLDPEAKRIYSKYFDVPSSLQTRSAQSIFEEQLMLKATRSNKAAESDIATLDQFTIVFKQVGSVFVFIAGDMEENEILLSSMLDTLCEALNILYRDEVGRAEVLKDIQLLMLAVDELVHDGIILSGDSSTIVERVTMMTAAELSGTRTKKKESVFERAIASARDNIAKSFLSS